MLSIRRKRLRRIQRFGSSRRSAAMRRIQAEGCAYIAQVMLRRESGAAQLPVCLGATLSADNVAICASWRVLQLEWVVRRRPACGLR